MKRTAQNLVEFALIVPLLLVILFGILEFAIFYRNVNVVQDIATEAAVAASRKIILDSMASNVITDTSNTGFNKAVLAASDIVVKRRGKLSFSNLTFTSIDMGATYGARPYALYKIDSTQTKIINGINTPVVTLMVDYRRPVEDGIMVQLVYQYSTLFGGVQLPVGNSPIVLLPKDIPINSTRIKQYTIY